MQVPNGPLLVRTGAAGEQTIANRRVATTVCHFLVRDSVPWSPGGRPRKEQDTGTGLQRRKNQTLTLNLSRAFLQLSSQKGSALAWLLENILVGT